MIICGVYLAEKGFGFGHDSNFFLLEDGKINCHVELERYLDEKNVRVGLNQFFEILNEFVPPNEVDLYAINFRKKRKQRLNLPRYAINGWHSRIKRPLIFKSIRGVAGRPYVGIRHHIGHLSASYYCSDFERAVGISFDGGGDCGDFFVVSYFEGSKMKFYERIPNLNIGGFFSHCGRLIDQIGQADLSVAGKIMALASYGRKGSWKKYIIEHLRLSTDTDVEKFNVNGNDTDNEIQNFLKDLEDACTEIVIGKAKKIMEQFDCRNLILGGGCALNINLNRYLCEKTDCELFINPSTTDAGLGLGFALFAHHHIIGNSRSLNKFSPFIGIPLRTSSVSHIHGRETISSELKILDAIIRFINLGKAVGIVQGRCEIGPRALGHRSILAAAHLPGIKDYLNTKVKSREWYRPIAPIVLERNIEKCFHVNENQKTTLKYMLNNVKVKSEFAEMFQSGTHIDGSARVQTVIEDSNEWFYRILNYLETKESIYGCLNTSLNRTGKPLVNDMKECFKLLDDTEMAAIVIENKMYISNN